MTLKRLWLFSVAIMIALLALFGVATALDLPVLRDPTPLLERSSRGYAAAVSVALLIADVLLPVPSSFLMIGNGTLFGPGMGALISVVGSMGAAWFGYGLGRLGAGRVLQRILSPEENRRAQELLGRHGGIAVIVTRPVPILAETVAIVAGGTRMSLFVFSITSLLGCIPVAVIYALAGARSSTISHPALVFGIPLLLGSAYWLVARVIQKRNPGVVI
ncbi:MAG: VTT domain-containing protein [Verrucomicrobia bacterium]|nr:VTT domain-containing protein [Verrucomicrobiota bacterium]MDA1086863.1 VTT domain-containing protein [Verrucomicrobiota bacterium]